MSQPSRNLAEQRIVTDVFAIMWALAADIRRVGSSVQLTVSQFSSLRLLEYGDMAVGELARTLHVAMPTVTQSTDSLVSKNLVERYADERDRRHVRLRITDAGRTLLHECDRTAEGYLATALADWPLERREEFARQLEAVKDMVLQAELARQP